MTRDRSNTARGRHRERGGAVVEFAIATLLFVPLAIYAIYASEIFQVGIKAQEAEMLAAWNVSGVVVHDLELGSGPAYNANVATAATSAQNRTLTRMADLDSFDDGVRSGRAMVGGSIEAVNCAPIPMPLEVSAFRSIPGAPPDPPPSYVKYSEGTATNEFLRPGGYVRCTARARAFSLLGSREFMRDSWGTRPPLIDAAISNFAVCGSGSNLNGCSAQNGIVVLVDDWALDDGSPMAMAASDSAWPTQEMDLLPPLPGPTNPKMFNPANAIFRSHGRGYGHQQVQENLEFFTDSRDDWAYTSEFKMGYDYPISTPRRYLQTSNSVNIYPASVTQIREAHLTPWDDGETYGTIKYRSMSSAFGARSDVNYLGHSNPAFKSSPP